MGNLYNTLFVLLICTGVAWSCSVDIYTNLPHAPIFPSTTLPTANTPVPSSSNPITVGHWSEVARLDQFRTPFSRIPTANPAQTNCPHTQTGLKNWHDASTWGSAGVPKSGADVNIPSGTQVLISSCSIDPSFVFGIINVPATSSLIFGDAPITIDAIGFNVSGSLFAGSQTCRLRNKITITLHGSRPSTVPALAWLKGISVQGSIDLHGALYTPTWTRLAMTARANDTILFIQDIVNWQPGQTIVITTSELKDSRDWHRNEEKIIKSVQLTSYGVVSAIELTTPLAYTHFGGREYQVEVALLSRNIVVQGAADSEPTDTANSVCVDPQPKGGNDFSTYPCENSYLTGWGAHVFVNGVGAQGRFSGVELFRVGQTNSLGRYPIHFHLLGNITNDNYQSAFVQDCSVHRSYFRCYAIHGTSGAKLTENTAYDAIGHCYFLEDGVEEDNIISYNQAAHIHPLGKYWNPSIGAELPLGSFGSQYLNTYFTGPTLILPSDMAAGCFYFTNTYNDIYGNAASGGFAGYSIPSLLYPVKLFASITTWSPATRPFRTPFRGNSAHSTGYWWATAGGIYVGGELSQPGGTANPNSLQYTTGRSRSRDTCTDKAAGTSQANGGCYDLNDQLWLSFQDNKVFLANRGLQNWGDRSELLRLEFHDVALSMNVFGRVWIDQMLMECRTLNNPLVYLQGCNGTAAPWTCNERDIYFFMNIGGFQWYDVGQQHILTNSIFRNCRNDSAQCFSWSKGRGFCDNVAVFTSLTHSDQFVPEQMQITNQITYQNVGDLWKYSTDVDTAPFVTVSGRDQNWYDYDGSASRTGVRTMIGSARAINWWKYNSKCTIYKEAWVCPMSPGDSAASVFFSSNWQQEASFGSDICFNGEGDKTTHLCPVVGTVNHFGSTNESAGYLLAENPKVTGPIINSAGGWFVRYTQGTPSLLNITSVQVKKEDVLLLAIPYPAGTSFQIWYQAASWCGTGWAVCRHNYTAVTSVSAVRAAFGDAYFWDNTAKILYLRVVSAETTFGNVGSDPVHWPVINHTDIFSRAGLTLYTPSSQTYIYIQASCNPCAAQPDVKVPAALNLAAPPTITISSITGSTIANPAASLANPVSTSAVTATSDTSVSDSDTGSSTGGSTGTGTGSGTGASTGTGTKPTTHAGSTSDKIGSGAMALSASLLPLFATGFVLAMLA